MINANGPRTGRPPTLASNAMVTSPHYLASASGLQALRAGGSAVDASIAINATLCVVYPHMSGIGGDAFWLIAGAGVQGVEALDASGPSAQAATIDYYQQRGHADSIPSRGALAALTTPGVVDGWRVAHERHGLLPWADLFQDAITMAREGMPVTRSLADWLAADEHLLKEYSTTADIYLPGGKILREGARLVQSDLANTLEIIAKHGARDGFYEGEITKKLCKALQEAGSPLRQSDFSEYQAKWVTPISTFYRGHQIYQMPPSTQGFANLQIMNLLEGFDVASWGEGTADYYHHIVEAIKIAFADRDEWLTDPSFVDIPLDQLLSKDYADKRRALISSERAIAAQDLKPGIAYEKSFDHKVPDGDTVHFCVADANGLVVSNIQSIYHDFGSCFVGGDTGILMQNRGSFFSLDTNHPNRLEPKKKTFHTIIPAMLMKDNKPVLAYGTMGGEGQPQTQAAILTRILDFNFNVQQAIEAPRWLMGRTWGMATRDLFLESRISDEIVRELKLRSHPTKMVAQWESTLGHAQVIRINHESGFYEGGADPRGDGAAMGF